MQNNDEEEKKTEETDEDLENLKDLLSSDDVDFYKVAKEISKIAKKNESPKAKVKKVLASILGFILSFAVYFACLGFVIKHISCDSWLVLLLYALGLSVLGVILHLLRPLYIKMFSGSITMVMFVKPIVMLAAMIVFNYLPQNYLVFDEFFVIFIYFFISSVIIGGFDYYRLKFM